MLRIRNPLAHIACNLNGLIVYGVHLLTAYKNSTENITHSITMYAVYGIPTYVVGTIISI